jgi:hypothetical protein
MPAARTSGTLQTATRASHDCSPRATPRRGRRQPLARQSDAPQTPNELKRTRVLLPLLQSRSARQGFVVCPLLDAALKLLQGCRCRAAWMPHDACHLASPAASAASCGKPVRGRGTLAMRAAGVTDHVGDRWYRRPPGRATVPLRTEPHAGLGERLHAICSLSLVSRCRTDATPLAGPRGCRARYSRRTPTRDVALPNG